MYEYILKIYFFFTISRKSWIDVFCGNTCNVADWKTNTQETFINLFQNSEAFSSNYLNILSITASLVTSYHHNLHHVGYFILNIHSWWCHIYYAYITQKFFIFHWKKWLLWQCAYCYMFYYSYYKYTKNIYYSFSINYRRNIIFIRSYTFSVFKQIIVFYLYCWILTS